MASSNIDDEIIMERVSRAGRGRAGPGPGRMLRPGRVSIADGNVPALHLIAFLTRIAGDEDVCVITPYIITNQYIRITVCSNCNYIVLLP